MGVLGLLRGTALASTELISEFDYARVASAVELELHMERPLYAYSG